MCATPPPHPTQPFTFCRTPRINDKRHILLGKNNFGKYLPHRSLISDSSIRIQGECFQQGDQQEKPLCNHQHTGYWHRALPSAAEQRTGFRGLLPITTSTVWSSSAQWVWAPATGGGEKTETSVKRNTRRGKLHSRFHTCKVLGHTRVRLHTLRYLN